MITYLYLKGYVPFSFGGITEIEYTPEKILQLIIGTNGSGKSSFLRALSLAPMHQKEFADGGMRKLKATFDGVKYELITDYSGKSPKHQFIVDGVNLNPGGTTAIQKELTEAHLGYTEFHHKLLTGKLKFTEMAPNNRKDLLILISGLKLDYALGVFDKLRSRHRDVTGAMKHVVQKYSDVASRLALLDGMDGIKETAARLEEELSIALPNTNFSVDAQAKKRIFNNAMAALTAAVEDSNKKHEMVKRVKKSGFLNGVADMDTLGNLDKDTEARLKLVQEEIEKNTKILEETEAHVSKISSIGSDTTKESLTAEIDVLKADLAKEKFTMPEDVADLGTLARSIYSCHSALLALNDVVKPGSVIYTPEEIKQSQLELTHLKERITKNKSELHHANDAVKRSEYAATGNVTCNNCDTVILAEGAMSPKIVADLKQKIIDLNSEATKLEIAHVHAEDLMSKVNDYINNRNRVMAISSDNPLCRYIFKRIESPAHVVINPVEAITVFHEELTNIQGCIAAQKIQSEIEAKTALFDLLAISGTDAVMAKFQEAEEKLASFYTEQKELKEVQVKARKSCIILGVFFDSVKNIEEVLIPNVDRAFLDMQESLRDDEVNNIVREKQKSLAELHAAITEYKTLSDRLDELKKDEEELALRKKGLQVLVDTVSPNKGLIARQLHVVVSDVVTGINSIIDCVWEKDLGLTIPAFGEKLDFNFLTQIEGHKGPDIKDLSMGQKEIVNLAMTLIVMKQMEIKDFPLMLDEVGANFDELHRGNLMVYIKEMLDQGDFAMIFMISHYAAEYGGFSNAEIVALNVDNIGIPSGTYNENIVIT